MMKGRFATRWILLPLLLLTIAFASCKSYDRQEAEKPDNVDRGTIRVSADESFKPLVDQFVAVYESRHPGTHIAVDYKPEAECMKDLLKDSVRMAITTRGCNDYETEYIVDSFRIAPKSMRIAFDAIAVIVHPDAPDSQFTMKDIRQILAGKFKKNLIPVFDGVKATSAVRFAIDSILRGDTLTPNAMAARSSDGVIRYVADHPDAIGFVGISWIGNPEDTMGLHFLQIVRMASLESTDQPGTFVKATQFNIHELRYPMVRDLVYTYKENYEGLGTAFANFMSGEIGQMITRRAYLVPAQKDFTIRPVRLVE